MNLACSVDQRDGITLVELDVTNPTRTTRRVRIENTLAGEILPPRRHGTPVKGWDEEGVTLSIDAGEHRALGYACQAEAQDPPARIVGSEPTDGTDTSTRTPETVVAALGDPRPPRDVVKPEGRGVPSAPEQNGGTAETTAGDEESRKRDRPTGTARSDSADWEPDTDVPSMGGDRDRPGRPVLADSNAPYNAESIPIPPAIDAWLRLKAEQIAADEPVDATLLSAVSRRAEEIATKAKR